MLVLRPVGAGVAGYYLRQGSGEWLGGAADLLGLPQAVERADLNAVLQGSHPKDGGFLPPVRSTRRRAGWDLIFAAPKSLSLLAATWVGSNPVQMAHDAAVRDAVEYLETDIGRQIVAASFSHRLNAGSEPHVHTHLLLANLTAGADGWSAVGRWIDRDALAAVYHLGLRHHLDIAGVPLQWRLRPDDLPDIVAVPRAAVRATSTRGHESRVGPSYRGRSAGPRDWEGAAITAGWSADRATRTVASGDETFHPKPPDDTDRRLATRVSSQLLMAGSTFTQRDVLVALARCSPAGLDAPAAVAWSQSFFTHSIRVDEVRGRARRTTAVAQQADRRVAEMLERRSETVRARGLDEWARLNAERDLAESTEAVRAARSILSTSTTAVLTVAPRESKFVAHAAVVGACSEVWLRSGMSVAVSAPTPAESRRWETLTGVEAFHPSQRTDVLIVDQAERRTPGELMSLLASAGGARLVLVEGGTAPRAAVDASLAFSQIAERTLRVDPGPIPQWRASGLAQSLDGHWRSPEVAAGHLIGRWADAASSRTFDALMVGLGVPEVAALNEGARHHLGAAGQIGAESLSAWGRSYAVGDRVIAFSRPGQGIRCGMTGTVRSINPRGRSATVEWPVGRLVMRREDLRGVGHGYAATPRLASRTQGSLFVLGSAEGLTLDRSRVAAQVSVGTPGLTQERERSPIRLGLG